jgi:adenylate kinase
MFILKIKELDVIRIQFTSVFFSLQVKLRLQTHYQNVESLLSIYEDVIVEVKGDALVDDVFAEIDKQLTSSLDKKTEMVASA